MRTRLPMIALAAGLTAMPAFATQQRSFVASNGNDFYNCTIAAPCRSFGAAIDQTNPRGEIIVQDSAGYGSVTITKSVSLISPAGIYAGITALASHGVTINAPGATVVLRGLSINGQGVGVYVTQALRVHVEGCEISGMASNGIVHAAPDSHLSVIDTIVRDNQGTGIGISALGQVAAVLDRVRSQNNAFDGLFATANTALTGVTVTISDSLFTANGNNGIYADAGVGQVEFHVERSTIARDANDGLRAVGANGTVQANVADSAFHANGAHGANVDGSAGFAFAVFANNRFSENGGAGVRTGGANAQAILTGNTFSGPQIYCQQTASTLMTAGHNVGLGPSCGATSPLPPF